MILFDPDLDPDPAESGTAAGKLPSARTLSRFLAKARAIVRVRGQVTVLLTTDPAIRRLNRQFLGKNKPTDVLSFPAQPIPGVRAPRVRAEDQSAGDLAVSVDRARRQAADQGHPLSTEIKILILHGLLHLAGYDHETDSGRMARRERALRSSLGLPAGLIERAGGSGSAAENGCPILAPAGRKGGKPQSSMCRASRSRVPQVRDPHGQALVRGVEIPILGPGKAKNRTGANSHRSRSL